MRTEQKPLVDLASVNAARCTPLGRSTLVALLVGAFLMTSGCSWGKKNAQPVVLNTPESRGSWLCEAGKAADDWDCIQSENIEPQLAARNQAEKTRTPVPEAKTGDVTDAAPRATGPAAVAPPAATAPPSLPATPQPIIDPDAASRPLTAPATDTEPAQRQETPPLTTAQAERSTEPAYAQLAYRPEEPVRIIDLPQNFYAAQLLAVSTKKQIEDFVVAQNLYNMSAARIEQNGQVLYVLLLGVYESKELAQRAVAAMPGQVQSMSPWIRPISGLQDAMIRGDRLAATAGIQ